MLVIEEDAVDPVDLAAPLDIDVVGAVDHDLGDRRVGEQRFERSEARDVVDHLLDQAGPLVAGDRVGALGDHLVDEGLDLGLDVLVLGLEEDLECAHDLGLEGESDAADQLLAKRCGGPAKAASPEPRGHRYGDQSGRCIGRHDGDLARGLGRGGGRLDVGRIVGRRRGARAVRAVRGGGLQFLERLLSALDPLQQ